jgi:diaminopimelate epimerase
MTFPFHKYHGTGNDFILIDDRKGHFPDADIALIAHWCHRRFGIGADGLILLRRDDHYDFAMRYFNSDGRESSMCGNGGRCIAHFAFQLGLTGPEMTFRAIDGPHQARLLPGGNVSLKMQDVPSIENLGNGWFLDTGSPHVVIKQVIDNHDDLIQAARAIRYNDRFSDAGVNVNFMDVKGDNSIHVRTYERGVEDETYSCGTGVVAAAIALKGANGADGHHEVSITTLGGNLSVSFRLSAGSASEVWLTGPATPVFTGILSLSG